MRSPEELEKFYETDLRPALADLDAQRKRILFNLGLTAGGIAALFGVATILLYSSPVFLIPCAIVGVVAFFAASYFLQGDYRWRFKSAVVAPLVSFVDPSLRYDVHECIPQGQFESSRLFLQGIDRYKGEDCVTGRIDKTALRFSEVHAEYKSTSTDSKGNRKETWHTIFKGLFFVADFNKEFRGVTVVMPDTAEKAFGAWIGQALQSMNMGRPGLVKLEDPEFEQHFAVHSDDQIEARYILSPALMRRLLDFRRKFGADVYISFANSSVFVAMPLTKDLFEPKLFGTLVDPAMINAFYVDLTFALGIVEELNLNTRVWTKQ